MLTSVDDINSVNIEIFDDLSALKKFVGKPKVTPKGILRFTVPISVRLVTPLTKLNPVNGELLPVDIVSACAVLANMTPIKLIQVANAFSPIEVTLAGIITYPSALDTPSNARNPIVFKALASCRFIEFRLEQF